jgi:H+-translocating NAD(P) transhydrogenase subunit alpha
VLVTEDMVKTMRPGSVIVDLAVEAGGNCPLSEKDKVVEKHGVILIGYTNLPSMVAEDSSLLYARNLYNFVVPMMAKDGSGLAVNWDDEIIKGAALTRDGAVIHPLLTEGAA